jgi:hypothetical protein
MSSRKIWMAGLVGLLLIAGASLSMGTASAAGIPFWTPPNEEVTGDPDVPDAPCFSFFSKTVFRMVRIQLGPQAVIVTVVPSRISPTSARVVRCTKIDRTREERTR